MGDHTRKCDAGLPACKRPSEARRAPLRGTLASAGMEARVTKGRERGWAVRGFTFVELMVVVTIIVILMSMAIPIYNRSIIRAKESVLHNNLTAIRECIDHYTYDKQKAPQQLQDLVTEGYLSKVPVDPMTGSNQSWKTIPEDPTQAVSQMEPGIFDVRSGSDKTSLEGTPYSDW